MRKAILVSFFIVLATTTVWSQQTPAPKPDEAAQTPIVRDPHSTNADLAVPLCPVPFNDSLETDGIATARNQNVTNPILRNQPIAKFTDEARRQKRKFHTLQFYVSLSLVVGVDGQPQGICLVRSAGYGLDANAAEAVQKYVFAPATTDGKPVPERISVTIDFRLY